MNDFCRSNVTIKGAAAITAVHSYRKRFFGNGTALWACLGGSPRIDFDKHDTSFFSFVPQHRNQLTPRGVVYRFGQKSASQTLYVKFLDCNRPIAGNEDCGYFVQVVPALIANAGMQFGYSFPRFAAARGAALAPRKRALLDTQRAGVPSGDRITGDEVTIAECSQCCKAHVEGDAFGASAVLTGNFYVKNDVPLAAGSADNCRPWFTRQGAMPADFNLTWDAKKRQLATLQKSHSIADAKVCRMVARACAEARESSFFTTSNSLEKCFERLIQLAQNLLLGSARPTALMRKVTPNYWQCLNLIIAAYRNALSICCNTMFQSAVVQLTEIAQHFAQRNYLRLIGFNSVPIAEKHIVNVAYRIRAINWQIGRLP